MKKLPVALIYARLLLGLTILFLSVIDSSNFIYSSITLLTIGLLTDIFDGIIARQLKVSTQQLRRLDSSIDQVFFISVAVATYLQRPEFFESHAFHLIILIASECLIYLVSFIRFRKEIATHTLGAKLWTLLLFATLIEIIVIGSSESVFYCCFWIGVITRFEIIAIQFILKEWTTDVPTFYHAIQLRNGRLIKRNKLFNG